MINPYRYELKYLITLREYELLSKRISYVLKHDHHYEEDKYHVRSLYFDDIQESSLTNKLDGVQKRKKYRLRLYNISPDFIRFECKIKNNIFIKKQQLQISQELCNNLVSGGFKKELLNDGSDHIISGDMIGQFFINRFVYSPSILVDYDRETYTDSRRDIRITFDSNLSYNTHLYNLFDKTLFMRKYFKEPMIILEIKYTKYLPTYIKNLLQLDRFTQTSISKYAMCRLAKRMYTY